LPAAVPDRILLPPVLLPGQGFVFGEHAKDLVSVNDGQRVILAGIGMMATPSVGIEPFNNLCPNGVFMDIFDQTEKIGLSITKDGFVASLKQVTNCTVSPVEVHRVGLVQALHDFGQGDIADLHEQMNVIVHEDIGVDKASGAVLVVTEE
jgi:hypothetical protein